MGQGKIIPQIPFLIAENLQRGSPEILTGESMDR